MASKTEPQTELLSWDQGARSPLFPDCWLWVWDRGLCSAIICKSLKSKQEICWHPQPVPGLSPEQITRRALVSGKPLAPPPPSTHAMDNNLALQQRNKMSPKLDVLFFFVMEAVLTLGIQQTCHFHDHLFLVCRRVVLSK